MALNFVARDFHSSFGSGDGPCVTVACTLVPEEWSGALALYWWGSADRETGLRADEHLQENLRLVSIETGRRVDGSVQAGVVRTDGERLDFPDPSNTRSAFSFVPAEPLDDGWYVLMADLNGLESIVPHYGMTTATYVEDAVMYTRVHIGSAPTWYLSMNECNETPRDGSPGYCEITVLWSAPVPEAVTTMFELRVNGEAAPGCLPSRGPSSLQWTCPSYPEGTRFSVRLVDDGLVRALSDEATEHSFTGGGSTGRRVLLVDPDFAIDVARAAE